MQTSKLPQCSLIGWIIEKILVFEVTLITYHYRLDFIMRVILNLKQPFVEVLKTVTLCYIEDKESRDRTFVVRAGNRFKWLLSSLHNLVITVSHICILMLRLSILIVLDPNSTPNVGSWSVLNLPSVNLRSKQLFPTPLIGL